MSATEHLGPQFPATQARDTKADDKSTYHCAPCGKTFQSMSKTLYVKHTCGKHAKRVS